MKNKSKQIGWNIYCRGKYLTTIYYDSDMTKEQVKQSLIDHDCYSSSIILRLHR